MIVKLSDGRFVNLANMTQTQPVPGSTTIRVFWVFASGEYRNPDHSVFSGADARAITEALDDAAARFRREAL
jgi:hypothetical protein